MRYVYQERIRTDKTTRVVEHLSNPNDLILNTAQMRDATHVQKFRIPSIPLDEDRVIQKSVSRAINQRKSVNDATSQRVQGQGGRGRGLAQGSSSAVDRQEGSSGLGRARGQGRGGADMIVGPSGGPTRQSRGRGRGRGHLLSQPGEILLEFNNRL